MGALATNDVVNLDDCMIIIVIKITSLGADWDMFCLCTHDEHRNGISRSKLLRVRMETPLLAFTTEREGSTWPDFIAKEAEGSKIIISKSTTSRHINNQQKQSTVPSTNIPSIPSNQTNNTHQPNLQQN